MGESDVNEKNQFEMIFELLVGAKKSPFQHNEKFAPAHYFYQPKNFIHSRNFNLLSKNINFIINSLYHAEKN